MEHTNGKSNSRGDLMSLLLLFMIFSMFLALKLQSLPDYIKAVSVLDQHTNSSLYGPVIVLVAMGIALLYSAISAENRSLKKIYFVSILPFIVLPDFIFFINPIIIYIYY